ncbi:putative histidine kinase-like protein M3YPp [Plenodomus tracheiphilus IPT5]|uniref:histidine kinase n=1 Tax=Plenodomus tracheiphilus IPT5 TaxID=1408161 RepID=A0A6A7BDS0_9PLEO|nr:putative histidine kinase-like protein M3YPp [Plenodomus tracheiphilus IPT5]
MQQLTPPPEDGSAHPLLSMPGNRLDWTLDLPQSDHVRFFRETDWLRSNLGPLDTWSPSLRLFTSFVLADSKPACLWWGPVDNLTAIYNEHYAALAGPLHPKLMGSTFIDGYPELWASISAYFAAAKKTRLGQNYSSAVSVVVERKGWQEEAFFSGSFVPVGGPEAEGFINTTYEVTAQALSERRSSMLNMLGSIAAKDVDTVYSHTLATLATNPKDVPLAMFYRLQGGDNSNILKLHGHIGLPEDHPLKVESATIDSEEGLIPDLRRAGTDVAVIDYDERFDNVSWTGWGAPSKKIAIIPIICSSRMFGYLIFGTNPFRPQDEPSEQFVRDVARMVSSLVTSANDAESSKKRQEQLEADLAFSDLKLRHLIDHASVGMCHASRDGYMLWANDHYYKLAGQSATDQEAGDRAFLDVYHEEDRSKAEAIWEDLIKGADHVTVELRVKRMYNPPSGDPEPAQLQVLAFPYRDELGCVRSVMACTTDISRLKWAQTFQARLAAEAREAKRHQEAFIDVVSHEMRNPLSAIVHCADAITIAVQECQNQLAGLPQPCVEALDDSLQSAKIILQCAHHQKRIIDDILTLSKLDSMLLSITPVAVKPAQLVDSIINMFEAELKTNQIAYNINPDSSLIDLDIDYLCFDPSRVTQIFINLLTNAIKFVTPAKDPKISIRFGACISDPRSLFPDNMFWATERKSYDELTNSPEWGVGEEVYLTFSVKDSGIGLQDKEIHKIFERFRQANVKTHVKYGGSGLGLFISKELTEKQGGEIGVSSVFGQGSTFGFYVKTRRVETQPQSINEVLHFGSAGTAAGPLHVLLVEDNLINQKVLGKQLMKAGLQVEVANHGLEALHTLEKQSFDVVLMDLEMPVLDGLGAMRQIRNRELVGDGLAKTKESDKKGAERLPIIAVTANVRKEQIDTAIAAGADRVMQKPFKAADLVYMMKSLLPAKKTALGGSPPAKGSETRLVDRTKEKIP